MNINQRAIQALEYRERAMAGKWVPRRIKVASIVILLGLTMVIWGTCEEPDTKSIGIASFLSGAVFMLVCGLFAYFRAIRAAWPFNEMVIDWNKVWELASAQPVKPPDA